MRVNLKINYKDWVRILAFLSVLALFAFDVRTFFVGALPISVITSLFFVLFSCCFYFLFLFPYRDAISKVSIRSLDILMFIFMFWFGVRMIYNIYLEEIEQTTFMSRNTYVIYYFFLCVLPYLICRWINLRFINIKKLLWSLFIIFLFALLISLKTAFSMLARGESAYDGRFEANELLDTIGYGHLALSFILVCFSLTRFYGTRWRWLLLFPICFGLFSMGIANSRGPFVALFVIIGVLCLLRIRFKMLFGGGLLLCFLICSVNSIDTFFQQYLNSNFVTRLMTIFTFNIENASGRSAFYAEGIKMFLDNPIWGRSILLMGDLKGGYVHNMIIEVFMAVGLIGGLLFLLINFRMLQHGYYLLKKNSRYIFFVLIFIQYLIYLQFSRSIILLPAYWASLACIYSGYLLEKRDENSDSYGIL